MVSYEEFKKVVTEVFKDYLPESMQNGEVEVKSLYAINKEMDGLFLRMPVEKSVSPTIYINDMYESYQENNELDYTIRRWANAFVKKCEREKNRIVKKYKCNKDNIVFQLINTDQNKKMLADVPHREFNDLSIIYRGIIDRREGIVSSTLIDNSFAEMLGLTERDLFTLAVVNTQRLFPPVIKSITEVIKELLIKKGIPVMVADTMVKDIDDDEPMYVITNSMKINGAASVLYENNLHELAERLESDLYLIPSSVHEMIAVSTKIGDPYEIAAMIYEANILVVNLEERLSNQVYLYDKEIRKISLATDTPNKKLDGKVSVSYLYE